MRDCANTMEMGLSKSDGGPPRWFCPVACGKPLKGSPALLYLSGVDGTGAGLAVHEKALGKVFHVQCLHTPTWDRTPLEGLIQIVEETVMIEHGLSPKKPLGDSFGGALALSVAARNTTLDLILILANPVYERMVNPLVEDVLKGKSGMLAAMGPSGSGKMHTVFRSARDPGMVSLTLRQIFSETGSNGLKSSRTFYLSMFEIYSERGKGERIMDLSPDRGDLSMQQSTIKGLQEVVIHDVQQAEYFIASGMLKRSTAMTNSNLQSSRSQCIINIHCEIDNFDEDAAAHSSTAMLTIVACWC